MIKPNAKYGAFVLAMLLLSSSMLALTGCSKGAQTEMERYTKPLRSTDYGSLQARNNKQQELRALEQTNREPRQYAKGTVSYSPSLADAVSSIGGVADARVFISDYTAFIGVVLDNTAQGLIRSKPSGERDSSVFNEPIQAPMSIHNNPFQSYLTVNDNSQLSPVFVQTVIDTVRNQQHAIREVHLSANKEFMYYLDEFAQVVWGGESLDPYMDQFNILINHQFFDGKVMPTSLKYYRNR
ncbi:hypothetical protein [Paenibacillus camelliae]|uniref:hypothetical protein n=1 Tax=Paenibacillus camelliae TaxID=512410 RepID=UPI00203F3745|nr:hypothetical protein [Paenibacillus camelliae]MCM3634658.1 hypothetical protein [Paenibacillus camelliae]